MNFSYKLFLSLIVLTIVSCNTQKQMIKKILASDNPNIKRVMESPAEFEVQIIYTEILRDQSGKVFFKDFRYNVDSKNYFYPASTVKLPIAVLALEKLNTIPNTSIDTEFTNEGTVAKLKFSQEITKIFAVSDNEASTNLLDFIGFDYVNQKMKDKGLTPFRLSHRLSGSDTRNPLFKESRIYKDNGSIFTEAEKLNKFPLALDLNSISKGEGYMDADDNLVKKPFDFSLKNYYPLETLHSTVKRIVFPEAFKEEERFKITEKDREFILFSMQNTPRNAGYDPIEYYDGFCKFLMFGDKNSHISPEIKIYNKVGNAYGTMTDSAYIIDKKNNVEFILSATILANKNKIYNDDTYEYDEVSLPFLGELGRMFYNKNKK